MRMPPYRGNARPPGPWRINTDSPLSHGLIFLTDGASVFAPIDMTGFAPPVSVVGSRTQSHPSCSLDDGTTAYWGTDYNPTQAAWRQSGRTSLQYSFAVMMKFVGASVAFEGGYANRTKVQCTSGGVFEAKAMFTSGSDANIVAPSSVATNVWHGVAVTYDQSNIRLYLDGAEVASAAETRTPEWGYGTDYLYTPGSYINGYLRYAAWWNRALSAVEIARLWAPETRWDLYAPA